MTRLALEMANAAILVHGRDPTELDHHRRPLCAPHIRIAAEGRGNVAKAENVEGRSRRVNLPPQVDRKIDVLVADAPPSDLRESMRRHLRRGLQEEDAGRGAA